MCFSSSSSSSGRKRGRPRKTDSTTSLANRIEKKYKLSGELEWVDQIPECPVYHPSTEEFQDPLAYIQTIAHQASKYGICKIVSPWKASVPASDVLTKDQPGFEFDVYLQHLRLHEWNENDQGTFLMVKGKRTYKSFEKVANKEFAKRLRKQPTASLPPAYVEKKYWRAMARGIGQVEYGANVDGSAFSSHLNDQLGQSNANLKTLPLLPQSALRLLDYQIAGVTVPMLYIGMLFSTFAWHVEDHFLYSINYHHSGAPKVWYGVPGNEASEFDKVALEHVYTPGVLPRGGVDGAAAKLSEKTTMFPPNLLLENHVPVYKAVQTAGEYVITFPRSYHGGFNAGFNICEAVNFTLDDWFPLGASAGHEYAKNCKLGNIPYEELLSKEAINLSKSAVLASQSPVKTSLINHCQSLFKLHLQLNRLGAEFFDSPKSQGTIVCEVCKRDCYISFVECDKCFRVSCLFHEFKSLNCCQLHKPKVDKSEVNSLEQLCEGKLVVFVREDINDVADAYEKFQQEHCSVPLNKQKTQATGEGTATTETGEEGEGKPSSLIALSLRQKETQE
ncbi:hypothetical protein COLO4_15221 [Corchorus olitorius]|uniref:JmjC domain-containing protein n=1 Tax=Corchorus olitorius TaxID=93759 RepID=A0A1R3JNZ4_9ROSI|nr:hypothetical protein COLO4_15221 [Corchorus olitorius]